MTSRRRLSALVTLLLLLVAAVAGVTLRQQDGGSVVAAAGTPHRDRPSSPPSGNTTASIATPTVTALAPAVSTSKEVKPSASGTKRAGGGAGAAAPAPRTPTVRKGASLWKGTGMRAALADSGVSWFYTWSTDRKGVSVKGVEFVPMIWGADSANDATLAAAKRGGDVLLGFNEPDLAAQSNITVERALDLWPRLQATGMRLGSPAVAAGADTAGGWLDRFMAGAAQRNLRVDFVALHWYGADFRSPRAVQQLASYVAAVHRKYHKPIWVTEYALMSFAGGTRVPPADVQAQFVRDSTAMLRSLSYVERYAWFSLPTPDDGSDGTGLYRVDGSRTAAGDAYRSAR